MWRATFTGLVARRLRFGLTLAAVAVAVSFVAGTFVLTDTLRARIDDLFLGAASGIDVTVCATPTFGSTSCGGLGSDRNRVPETLVARVAKVDGVARAEGILIGIAQIVDRDGHAIQTRTGPTLGFSWPHTDHLGPLRIRSGRKPAGTGEVAVDVHTAHDAGFRLGDRVRVQFDGPPEPFVLVGLLAYGDATTPGPTLAAFDTATAQRVFRAGGLVDTISVEAAGDITPEALAERINASGALPPGILAVPGAAKAKEDAGSVRNVVDVLEQVLLVFAAVGLFVGAFLILNTFSALVAQRVRELSLLRALGAAPHQVAVAVVVEAAAVGALGALAGICIGIGLSFGLLALLDRLGIDLPSGAPVLSARAVVIPIALGVVVSAATACIPARRAARVKPIEGLTEGMTVASSSAGRARVVVGVAVTALGAVLLVVALASRRAPLLYAGAGTLALAVGVTLVLAWLARVLVRLVRPVTRRRRAGVAAALGHENAQRNPRRTANTSAALMIGITLVVLVATIAASARASVGRAIEDGLRAEFVLSASEFFPFPGQAAKAVGSLPEVEAAASVRLANARVDGGPTRVAAIDPTAFAAVADLGFSEGALDRLRPGAVLVERDTASANGWHAGDTITVGFSRTGDLPVTIGGLFRRNQLLFANYVISMQTYELSVSATQDSVAYVKVRPGVPIAQARAALQRVLRDYPSARLQTAREFRRTIDDQIARVLRIVDALLAFAVITALLGIANALALSVVERTRELGLLRTVGMSPRQVATAVRVEALLVTLVGTVVGVGLGLVCARVLAGVLGRQGIAVFSVPVLEIAVVVAVSLAAGLVAAALPARRAGRLDVLAAIAHE